MQWLLTRPGQQQEGPYEEAVIIGMIQSGQLAQGYISTPGSNQWWALHEHPPFAQALQYQAGHQPAAAGYQPAAAGQGAVGHGYAPAAAPAQGQFGQAGYGQAGYGQAGGAGAYAHAPAAGAQAGAAPQQKGKLGLMLGVGAGVLVLLGGIGAAVYLFLFTSSGSQLSAAVPKDTQVFVEFPDLVHAFVSAKRMDVLDQSKLDGEKQIQEVSKGLRESFALEKDAGEQVINSLRGVAFAARELNRTPEFAMLLRFSDADAVEQWLKADRFTKEGNFGKHGVQYLLERDKTEDQSGFNAYRSLWSGMSARKDSSEVLVWFAGEGVLAMGNKDLLDDIDSAFTDDAGSLAKSEAWAQTDFEKDSVAIGFVNPDVLDGMSDEDVKKAVRGYFDGVKPFTAALRLTSAGPVLSMSGQLKGNKIDQEDMISTPAPITLHNKLPNSTVLYMAAAGKRSLGGKDLEKRIIKELQANDEAAAKQVEEGLEQMNKELGFDAATVFDAIGDEVAFGLAVDQKFKLDLEKKPEPGKLLDQVAAVMLMTVGDQDKANKLIKVLRTKGFEESPLAQMYDVKKKGDEGFVASPKPPPPGQDAPPLIDVGFEGGVLVMAVGGKPMVEAAQAALGGKDALGGDAAHKAALDALANDPSALMWLDGGRLAQTLLDGLPGAALDDLKDVEEELGLSRDLIRRTGDQRLTAALAVGFEAQPTEWNFTFESLNAPAFGVLAGIQPMVEALGPALAAPSPDLPVGDVPGVPGVPAVPGVPDVPAVPAVPAVFIPNTGVVFCDSLLSVQHACGVRLNDSAMQARAKEQGAAMKLEFDADAERKAKAAGSCRDRLSKFFIDNPQCGLGQ